MWLVNWLVGCFGEGPSEHAEITLAARPAGTDLKIPPEGSKSHIQPSAIYRQTSKGQAVPLCSIQL